MVRVEWGSGPWRLEVKVDVGSWRGVRVLCSAADVEVVGKEVVVLRCAVIDAMSDSDAPTRLAARNLLSVPGQP